MRLTIDLEVEDLEEIFEDPECVRSYLDGSGQPERTLLFKMLVAASADDIIADLIYCYARAKVRELPKGVRRAAVEKLYRQTTGGLLEHAEEALDGYTASDDDRAASKNLMKRIARRLRERCDGEHDPESTPWGLYLWTRKMRDEQDVESRDA
jgi:hypothetical protein